MLKPTTLVCFLNLEFDVRNYVQISTPRDTNARILFTNVLQLFPVEHGAPLSNLLLVTVLSNLIRVEKPKTYTHTHTLCVCRWDTEREAEIDIKISISELQSGLQIYTPTRG